jgi:hypothetical protein
MTLSTSRNLTVLGIATILGAIAQAALAIFDGDAATNVDWTATITAITAGAGMILAKGAASTGGTVDASGKPV